MADKKSIENVRSIIEADDKRRFVVVSAPGKRFSTDEKVTDLLYRCYDEKVKTGTCKATFLKVRERYTQIAKEMGLKLDMEKALDAVQKGIDESDAPDFAASRGEYLSALFMAEVLDLEFVDASDIIKFNAKGQFDADFTNDLVKKRLENSKGAVIPGFYGMTPERKVKTFSRGGSDLTGSIIARGVNAEIYENWTDVDGFMTADPRIVKNSVIIDTLSFAELRELSYMGASVLHPESIFPLKATDIAINIKNTFNPKARGTMIVNGATNHRLITGIAGKRGFTTILLKKSMMNSEVGFCRKILSILEYYGIGLEHMPTGIDTMSLVLADEEIKSGVEEKLIDRIKGEVNPDSVTVFKDISLIAVVGHGMSEKPGTAARVFTALAKANVNVRLIDQGSSELNIIVGVRTGDLEGAITAVYKEFFNE